MTTKKSTKINNAGSEESIKTIIIGEQEWMFMNLNVDRFRNGDIILQINTPEEWQAAGSNKEPAWCYYDFNSCNEKKYGKLYNWYAVNDPRGLAPNFFHIPTILEWGQLAEEVGGLQTAGQDLKSTKGWESQFGRDRFKFSALPGGMCYAYGQFDDELNTCYMWSSSETDDDLAHFISIDNSDDYFYQNKGIKSAGFAVRCLRD